MTNLTRASSTAALLLLVSIRALGAQSITVSGNPGLLRISTAVAGTEPVSVMDAVTTYTVNTPASGGNVKYAITMQLNANMPAGVTLSANLVAPPQATTSGLIALDITARNVVTNIKKNITSTQSITYQLDATVAAGVVPVSNRTVTLTVIVFP